MSKIKKVLVEEVSLKKLSRIGKKKLMSHSLCHKCKTSYLTVLGPRNVANFGQIDLQKTRYMSVFVYVIIIKF
jgi:hypothetical protein